MKALSRRRLLAGALSSGLGAGMAPHLTRAQEPSPSTALPWHNWSGGQTSQPAGRFAPATEQELIDFLTRVDGPLRPVGAGHSFSGLVPTDGHLVVLDRLTGVLSHDADTLQATFGAGIRLSEAGPELEAIGQAMYNLPDIDRQTLAGAISTATHGTGLTLNTLSAYVTGLKLVTPAGQVLDLDAQREPALFAAAQVSLGALGFVTEVRMRNMKTYRLEKTTYLKPTEDVLAEFDQQARAHMHFEMFPLTHSKYASVQVIDETDEPINHPMPPPDQADPYDDLMRAMMKVPPGARSAMIEAAVAVAPAPEPVVDVSYKILSNVRSYRFNEMEYSVPLEAGAACVREILRTVDEQNIDVAFPLEYRYVAGDDLALSMFSGGPRASISVHQDANYDYRPYFEVIEPIFWKYDGRPHWGKLHTLKYEQLSKLYPKFKDYLEIRAALDPTGRLLNPHLRGLFGIAT
ncbi:MAG TPA: D-arabinono-1,4-lactone oxidase [Pseudomonadales bacterium]|nr:D-arabinono-1,4-lactone oxidase [Pseudomonadales bacterium]